MTETVQTTCRLCEKPWWEHGAYNDEPPPEAVEGEFDVPIRGLYCP